MRSGRVNRPETIWLAVAGVLVLALAASGLWLAWSKYRQAALQLAEVEPRYARLAGLLQSGERLKVADEAIRTALNEFVYPMGEDANQIGNAALQRVRDLATARGLRVASSQAAGPREDKEFDRIGLTLRVEGEWSQLVELLREMARLRPLVNCANLQIGVQNPGAQASAQTVFGQFDLYVLKERKP